MARRQILSLSERESLLALPYDELTLIFPNEESIMRLLGAVLTEQNEEWLLQNRYLPQHSMAEIDQPAETEVIEALPLSA